MEYLILFICLGFLYLLFKPSRKLKTKEQKQAEILAGYRQEMDSELTKYVDDKNLFLEKKTALLKVFAEELNRNLFFDEDEVRALIQKLANYKIKG